jgi:cytochrome c
MMRRTTRTLLSIALPFAIPLVPRLLVAQTPAVIGSAARGEQLFGRRCAGCHSLVVHRTGPRLGDVYGRRAGSAAGFRYSDAVAAQAFAWSDSSLAAWLAGPQDFIRGAAMSVRISDARERADIVSFLRMLTPATPAAQDGANARR